MVNPNTAIIIIGAPDCNINNEIAHQQLPSLTPIEILKCMFKITNWYIIFVFLLFPVETRLGAYIKRGI